MQDTPPLDGRRKALAQLLLKHPEGLRAHEITAMLTDYGVQGGSPDTVRKRLLRDLKALHALDLAAYEEGKRRHTVWYPGRRKTVEMMPVEQAVALTALSLFGELPLDEDMTRRITPLMEDARQSLQNEGRYYATLNRKIAAKPWVARRKLTAGIPREIFDAVLEATLREQKISFGYRSSRNRNITRNRVSPLALLTYREIVYLAFYEEGDPAPMTWPLHRFTWVKIVAGARITPPAGWFLDDFVRDWSPIPEAPDAVPTMVKLRFLNEDAVRNLRDAPLLECEQSVVEDVSRPGTFLFSARLKPNRELLTWILYFGRHVEVLEPEGLKQAMRVEVDAMATLYLTDHCESKSP